MHVFRLQVGFCWLLIAVGGKNVLVFSMAGAFEIGFFDFDVGDSESVYIVPFDSVSRPSRTR
jgi:hypothetical protein